MTPENLENKTSTAPISEGAVETVEINQDKLNLYMEKLKLEQNLPFGIIGGLAAAVLGAVIWAMITVITEFQIGYMAIAIGFMVGYAVKITGKGISTLFGIIGASFALLGCVLGNLFSMIGFAANAESLGYFEILTLIDFAILPEILIDTFNPMDILFYGIAIYEGYRFSFREITENEIINQAGN